MLITITVLLTIQLHCQQDRASDLYEMYLYCTWINHLLLIFLALPKPVFYIFYQVAPSSQQNYLIHKICLFWKSLVTETAKKKNNYSNNLLKVIEQKKKQ